MTGSWGQDWASYQDWSPSTAGIGFVGIKVTEGTGYVNPRYTSQLASARAGHLVVMHYHFVRPGSMTAQADYFLRKANIRPGDVIALDWEDTGVSGADKDAWIKYVQAKMPGHKVILYCNRDFWTNRDTTSFAGDGLWIADPDVPAGQPRVKAAWLIHQYGERGGTDLDFCRLDAAALATWAAGTTPTPTPEDDMPTPADVAEAVMDYQVDDPTKSGTQYVSVKDVLWWIGANASQGNAAVRTLTAQVAALTAAVGALAKGGGLTAEQITAAAKAGADEALAQLGHALDGTQP